MRDDSSYITLANGKHVEYHASFNFPSEIYGKMKQEDRDKMKAESVEYKRSRSVQSVANVTQSPSATLSLSQTQPDATIQVGKVNAAANTMMGGRNEQVNQRAFR